MADVAIQEAFTPQNRYKHTLLVLKYDCKTIVLIYYYW